MINYLNIDQVYYIYNICIDKFGGTRGIRDKNLLESAVARPQQTFGGVELYPDLYTKVAALGHSLLNNHCFIDGNKRTAIGCIRMFLRENKCDIALNVDEQEKFILDALQNKYNVEHIACWIKANSISIS